MPARSTRASARGPSGCLAAAAEIAAALASAESVGAVVPHVLELLGRQLRTSECAIWVGSRAADDAHGVIVPPSTLRRAWAAATDERVVSEQDVMGFLDDGEDSHRGFFGLRLLTGPRMLAVLVVRRAASRPFSAEEATLVRAVGDIVAMPLRAADYARRLESEVVARTMEIEDQRRFTAKIIDSLPVGLYVIDREYRIQAWNRKRETGLQGVSRTEAIGRTIFEILHRQPAEVLRREFEDVFETGRLQQFQIESSATGETRTYRITKIPMRLDDTEVTHVITIGEDITDWREAQDRFAQAEKLAGIGTLAAGVMHEINNPLATIGACAEGLSLHAEEKGTSANDFVESLRESLRIIQHEVQRCKGIVQGVLDFSRPKPSAKGLLDINSALEKSLFLLKHHSRFKKLSVVVEAQKGLPPVIASEEQVIQVFMALMLNAMDAMHEQGTITLRTRADAKYRTVVAEVVDQGGGIRSQEMPKIFEPFFTTKPPGRGTGLGLSICYAIVSDHDGRIEVESTVGQGSVFRIILPQASTEKLRAAV